MYSCESCSKSFKERKNLNQHIRSVHGPMKFTCSYCERSFTRKADAQKHERLIHQNICESVCSKRNVNRSVISDVAPAKRERTTELPSPPPVPTDPPATNSQFEFPTPQSCAFNNSDSFTPAPASNQLLNASFEIPPRRQFQSIPLNSTRNFNFCPHRPVLCLIHRLTHVRGKDYESRTRVKERILKTKNSALLLNRAGPKFEVLSLGGQYRMSTISTSIKISVKWSNQSEPE